MERCANTCFHKGCFPTSLLNSKNVKSNGLDLWTGVFKTNVVYKYNANNPEERGHDRKQFGSLIKSESSVKLRFTKDDSMKKLLCVQDRSMKKTQTTHVTSDTEDASQKLVPTVTSVVLGVLLGFIALAYVVHQCRKKNQGARQTRVEHVPEQTNYITPISDEEGSGAYATVQDNDTSGGNGGYEKPNPPKNVYESLRESRVEGHGYGTSGQATDGFYQPLKEERMDTHNYEIAEQSKELPYDSLGDTTKDASNYETSNQTINAAAYEWVE